MKGKTVLITGATDGIGKQTTLELAQKGAIIFVHGRNEKRCEDTVKEIINASGNKNVEYFVSDFSSLENVKIFADEVRKKCQKLDVLINNAGIYMNNRELSENGYEMTFAVNHLAPFLLTMEVLPVIKKSDYARIINVASIAHTRGHINFDDLMSEKEFNAYGAYAQSKLANVVFSNELAERLSDTHVSVNSLHPGVISTKLLRTGFDMTGASVKKGAETSVYLASSEKVNGVTGKYFVDSKETPTSEEAQNKTVQKKLWEVSEELVSS